MSGAERREHERRKVLKVEVRVASTEAFRASYLRDLSLGGLFVRSKKPLPLGTAVVIELLVATLEPVRLHGDVVRLENDKDGNPRGFGVKFSDVDATTQASLKQIIAAARAPPTPLPQTEVGALVQEIAELRGTVEAYEESIASMHEREIEYAHRIEELNAERKLLKSVAAELQSRVKLLEEERKSLDGKIVHLVSELAAHQEENKAIRETSAKLSIELQSSLAAELDKSSAAAESHRNALEQEIAALRKQLDDENTARLRGELQELSAQLDDERLKSMALERALQRFSAMGGVVPPREK
ncbi:MAG: PilZ domain-containing protein [Archangium sp.]